MTSINRIQIALQIWGAFFTIVSSFAAYLGREYHRKKSLLLTSMLLINTIFLISDAISWGVMGVITPKACLIQKICDFLVFVSVPILAINVAFYFSESLMIHHGDRQIKQVKVLCVVGIIDIILIIYSQFTDFLYYYDEYNVYHRTPNYIICSCLAAVMLVILAVMILNNRKNMTKLEMSALIIYILVPFLSNLFQMFHYGLSLNNVAITFSMLFIFLTHEVEMSRDIVRQKQTLAEHEIEIAKQELLLMQKDAEIAEKKIQISISQMQPHFIFNALASIEQLCKKDSAKAANATHYFARYLRTNMTALSHTDLVRFRDELEHVRTYVWLEKMRFGEDVDYEEVIETDNFKLPALSIQPLVENAIKHGMMETEDGVFHVNLHSYEDETDYYVVVSDDGNGFDPKLDQGTEYVHVGLKNVEERIVMMVHGEVTIDSRIGEGTRIKIRIPKNF